MRTLSEVPVLDAAQLQRNWQETLNPRLETEVVLTSGGTTGSTPKVIPRLLAEFRLVEELELWAAEIAGTTDGLVLQLGDIAHGLRVPQRTWQGRRLLQLPIQSEAHLQLISEVLAEGKVTAVNGAAYTVALVSNWIHTQGPIDHGLQELWFGGGVLTPRLRRKLRELWGDVSFRLMFGLTEFHQGHAVLCDACSGYHFGHAVYPELRQSTTVVPSAEGEPGIGEIVLSHLAPFSQLQPLMRYATGDLARCGGICDAVGDLSFEPIGRIEACPPVEGRPWPALAVAAALDDIGPLYRRPVALLSGAADTTISVPRHRTTFDGDRVSLDVELAPTTRLTEAERTRLKAELAVRVAEAVGVAWGTDTVRQPTVHLMEAESLGKLAKT